jgi:xanthosine utilization system XapX-like protein
MSRLGPTRGELKLRLAISLVGLALMIAALFWRGLPQGPAIVEVVGIAGLFFGGSAIWTLRKLIKGETSDGL